MKEYDIRFAIIVEGDLLRDEGEIMTFTFPEALIVLKRLRVKHDEVRSIPFDPEWVK